MESGKYLHDLYKLGSTPWTWHKELFNRAKKNKIICFSSPFDIQSAVDFLQKFKVPAYKIASFENNHIPLVEKIIKTKKTDYHFNRCNIFKRNLYNC